VLVVMLTIASVTGLVAAPEIVDRLPGDPPRLVAGVARIREALGFEASYDLNSMIESAWAGWQARNRPS
jgi:UDP-glucose 4-epimerase